MQNEEEEVIAPTLKNEPTISRFNNPLKSNLIHIQKNLYMNRTDPLYYEKILRYSDPKSSDAQDASDRIQRLQYNKNRVKRIPAIIPPIVANDTRKWSATTKGWLFSIILLNFLLLISILNIDTIRAIVSSIKHAPVGMDVIYETVDVPYLIYIGNDLPIDRIEKTLFSKISEMGKQKPMQNVQLYGILTSDPVLIGKIVPLASDHLKDTAFVIVQYNASIDKSVKIQFINKETQKPNGQAPPLTMAASNLVRTALQSFIAENRAPPSKIEDLLRDYPNNYLSFIPNEAQSSSNQVVSQFDGTGGWVYKQSAKELFLMFYPNTLDEASAQQIPYSPVKIVISKNNYNLKVTTDHFILASKSVGLGKENRTPVGQFTVQSRVLEPLGQHPLVYGKGGLSLGQYALHGTYDEASIQSNQSLGCVRLTNADILDIFPLVPKGASVQIVSAPSTLEQTFSGQPNLLLDLSKLFPAQKPQIIQSTPHINHWLG
jgi:lipoprotein-anchoring transpeptidase ErfK/SrfK